MQVRKAVAVGLGALMTGATLAFAGMATDLSNVFPSTGTSAFTGANSLVVVGTGSNVDLVGAVDIAARLGGTVAETKTIPGATTTIDGTEKDGISICTANGVTGCNLATAAATGSAFPAGLIMYTTHFTGLKDSTISWKSNDYDYKEQVDITGVTISHDIGTDKVNGTETMVIEDGDVKYEYVFDKALNLSSARTAGTYGTLTNPDYTYPIKVKLLGKDFTIVGVGTSSFKALVGSTGEASATSGVTFGDYTVYATQGATDSWAKIIVKDKTGAQVGEKSINNGDSYDFSSLAITVKVTGVRAIGTSGEISGVDVVVGETGAVEKEYTTSADVTTTGTGNTKFSAEDPRWGIQASGFTTSGYIPAGAKIQVVYKPASTEYYKAGSKISLPNNYGELGFTGWNTDKFVTITVKPYGSTTAYMTNDTLTGSNLYGLEISADKTGSVGSTSGNWFDKAYVLFNATVGIEQPFMIGFWDKTKSKIIVNSSAQPNATAGAQLCGGGEYLSDYLGANYAVNTDPVNCTYAFPISYMGTGDATWYLNVTVNATHGIQDMKIGLAGNQYTQFRFQNKTASTSSAAMQFRLGATAASSEDTEVLTATGGTAAQNAGKKTQEIVADDEVLIVDTNTYAGSDQAVFKVPAKRLGVKMYFGKVGSTATSSTYTTYVPVTTPVGKLESDYTDASIATTGKNIILVGGPCANKFVATLMNATSATCIDKWVAEVGKSSLAEASNMALIKVVENAFETGKAALIVAGTEAKDTRNAAAKVMAGGLTGAKLAYSTAASSSQ